MSENVIEFTDANFETEVISNDTPVLVDFWAPWCGPCKMLTPTIEKLADTYAGKVKIGKLNTDENPQVASSNGINAIPTVFLYKGGQVVDRFVGVTPEDKFAESLDQHI